MMSVNHARSWKQSAMEQPESQETQVVVKVRRSSWITKGEKVLYSLICMALVTASIFIVSYSSSTDTVNREIQSLEQSVNNQLVVNEGLLFEVRELSKPERITKIAKSNGLKIQDGAQVKRAQLFNN